MCKRPIYIMLFVSGVIASVGSLCLGEVVGVSDVVMDGTVLVSAKTPNGYQVIAGVNLFTGRTTTPQNLGGTYAPQYADDFDFKNWAGNEYPLTTVLFGGQQTWRDSNGDQPDFFIFEGAASKDTTDFRALFPDGTMGQPLTVQSSQWVSTGVTTGQPITGIAFSITDLKDAAGSNLPSNAAIQGLVIGPMSGTAGVDPAVTAAVIIGEIARGPAPGDGQTDVPRDVILSWAPGASAKTHDVYFGASFDDVNNAGRSNPLSVLVSQDQDATTYDLPTQLGFAETWYWRIDEVRAAPDSAIFKGQVWSFTTEPYAYPVTNVIATSNGTSETGEGPGKTVDRSGLNAADQHSTAKTDMWLATAAGGPLWIQFEFDRIYKLHELLVWNHNGDFEKFLGFGVKSVNIEYSANGTDWTALGEATFNQATANATYGSNTTVSFGGVAAKYVRLNVVNAYGATGQSGLSEVRFLYIPTYAREPKPVSKATNVAVDAALSWRGGREAASHDVYLSTDQQAVIDGTAPVAKVTAAGYAPTLEIDRTYYWKVNEVNEADAPSVWEGSVWSFSTPPYVVVDDFESYSNDSPKRVFQTWTDGLGFSADEFFPNGNAGNGTGSAVGYDPAAGPIMETVNVHGGKLSMPLAYDGLSEATRTFDSAQDWAGWGAKTLVVFFHGDPGNTTGQLYVKINNQKVVYANAAALSKPMWRQWNIDLASVGTSLQSVTKLTIGIDGGKGTLFIDDIVLYRVAPAAVIASEELWVEAESGTVSAPMGVASDDPKALGGKYIGTLTTQADSNANPPTTGVAEIPITVKGGTYQVSLRVLIPGDNDSLWVRIQGGTAQTTRPDGWVQFNDIPRGQYWHVVTVHDSQANKRVVQWTLAAGTYTMQIAYREAGACVDAIVIQSVN